MKRLLSIALFSLSISFSLAAQTARSAAKDTTLYDFVVIDTRFQNQFAFWGRDYGRSLPFMMTTGMYYFHSGFWMSASDFKFFNADVPNQMGLSIGYFKDLSSKVDWSTSYTQFYVPDSDIPSSNKTQAYVQTTFGLDWGVLYSTLQMHGLINQNSDIFFTSSHSRYFQFNKPLFKEITVSFEPKISFTAGTHNFEYANGLVVAPGGGGVVSQTGDQTNAGGKVQPLNFDFIFPLKFALGYFTFEPSWKFTMPFNANPILGGHGLSIWSIGLNYSIPVKRKRII